MAKHELAQITGCLLLSVNENICLCYGVGKVALLTRIETDDVESSES